MLKKELGVLIVALKFFSNPGQYLQQQKQYDSRNFKGNREEDNGTSVTRTKSSK